MLESFTLKFSSQIEKIKLSGDGITIFVGANNSGKSLVLRELEAAISSIDFPKNLRIVDDFDIKWPSETEIDEFAASLGKVHTNEQDPNFILVGKFEEPGDFHFSQLSIEQLKYLTKDRNRKGSMSYQFSRFFFIRLDGRTRFQLSDDRQSGDLLEIPKNILAKLFVNEDLREKVRELTYEAFGQYFVIDPLMVGTLRIRLSLTPPQEDEQSLGVNAREFHKNAIYIKDSSDGVQAYVGVLTAVVSRDYKTICIDEPEAFLHPPLAKKLGSQLARLVSERSGSLIASTHSADFLMGCVQSASNVNVVRLEYSNGESKGRFIDPVLLRKMFQSPLMRSANVISALFYDGVVITESDNDRVFYAEVYHRIARTDDRSPSVLFINAQNKQTIKSIMAPLREFGVPAVAITDIDILKDGGTVWADWMRSARVPAALHDGYANQRDAIKKKFEEQQKDMKRDGGIFSLKLDDRNAAENLFDVLGNYGVFVVRRGELESWLPSLFPVGKKTDWVISILERMGDDPLAEGYVEPTNDDVWKFMRDVISWIKNPNRRGV